MSRAVQLARRGQYTCDPNPRVGCVISKANTILAEGWHAVAGEAHAEINAINACADASGAKVYLSLEPCAHHGKTPPCVDALIKANVSDVIISMLDPNPAVSGKGIKQLEAAGIHVQHGLLRNASEKLNPGFIKRMTKGLPYLRCKMAMSLDGRTALANGVSQWISNASSRCDVHKLRAASSAILTSIETVLQDDAGLNPRGLTFDFKQPVRVIIDRELKIPAQAKLLTIPGPIIIYTQNENKQDIETVKNYGADVVTIKESACWLREVLIHLAEFHEINDIMVEAGATFSGALIEAGLLDELIVYVAPSLMGHHAKPLLNLPQYETIEAVMTAEPVDIRQFDNDMRFTYRIH